MASFGGDASALNESKCDMCHGADGKGSTAAGKATKARDFCSDEVKRQTDGEWTTILTEGKNKMPSYDKKLTEAKRKGSRSLHSQSVRVVRPGREALDANGSLEGRRRNRRSSS
jgi:hypothetical protein